uniref:Uncharacterized protein n=1 Tax=Leptospirillum ferrodiazotrophum TaxID=412449 RepID=C6HYY2_9BACT|nr:MAG: hypothetical protein UBAL3_94320023 [Leptospirillum ferrodiazotrophum]
MGLVPVRNGAGRNPLSLVNPSLSNLLSSSALQGGVVDRHSLLVPGSLHLVFYPTFLFGSFSRKKRSPFPSDHPGEPPLPAPRVSDKF